MTTPFILGINGSPHKSGLCVKLLKAALTQSRKEGAKTKLVHLKDHEKHFFPGNYTTRIPKELKEIFNLLKSSHGIIFTTPVFWFNMSALMKNFIDQLTILELKNFELEGKVASFIATAEEDGGMEAILEIVAPINQMGLMIPPHAMFFFNKKIASKSEHRWMERDARLIGGNIVKMVRLTNKDDEYLWDYKKLKK